MLLVVLIPVKIRRDKSWLSIVVNIVKA
jgi:hypothetical protein